MKKIFALGILSLLTTIAFSQKKDSARYYYSERARIIREYHDSAMKDPRIVELQQKLAHIYNEADYYSGISLYTETGSVNYDKFNADNALAGFGPMKSPGIAIGFGITVKNRNMIYDFNLFALGLNNKVRQGNDEIKSRFSSLMQFNVGYDLVKSRRFNIYPYLGLGFRSSVVEYKTPVDFFPSPAGISQIVANNRNVIANRFEITYQAGVGAEVVLTNLHKMGGTIFFVKGGTDRPFKPGSLDINGYRYKPDFKYGNLMMQVGFKFFGR